MGTIKVSKIDSDLAGRWSVDKNRGTAYRYVNCKMEELHRLVAARLVAPKVLTPHDRVAYRDGNPLNCTRSNILIESYLEQNQRRSMARHEGIPYFGVYVRKRKTGRQFCQVRVYVPVVYDEQKRKWKYRVVYGGDFPLEKAEDAARAYDALAVKLLPHPRLNFPEAVPV